MIALPVAFNIQLQSDIRVHQANPIGHNVKWMNYSFGSSACVAMISYIRLYGVIYPFYCL
jgi:hypothetical protein